MDVGAGNQRRDPEARMIFVVARDQPVLFETLRREFSSDREIEVIMDRRHGERRQVVIPYAVERRRAERRLHNDAESQLKSLGWALVRTPRARTPRV
jgi:hypothetical protein